MITDDLIGWGDILFLVVIVVYLPFVNYVIFYICSLIAVLLIWLIWQSVADVKSKFIPLAGLQSILLAVYLFFSWVYLKKDVFSELRFEHLL